MATLEKNRHEWLTIDEKDTNWGLSIGKENMVALGAQRNIVAKRSEERGTRPLCLMEVAGPPYVRSVRRGAGEYVGRHAEDAS